MTAAADTGKIKIDYCLCSGKAIKVGHLRKNLSISRETNNQKNISGTSLWPVGAVCSAKNPSHRLEACGTRVIVFLSFLQEATELRGSLLS